MRWPSAHAHGCARDHRSGRFGGKEVIRCDAGHARSHKAALWKGHRYGNGPEHRPNQRRVHMTKISLTAIALLAIITGSAFAAPKGDRNQANTYSWQADQSAGDFQLQGR